MTLGLLSFRVIPILISVMKPTLKDIALSTGLSISTVSRVLRGKAKRESENVELILRTAQNLGYPFYNDDLKNVVNKGKPLYVALVAHTEIGEFYSSFFAGFGEAAMNKGIQISLFDVAPENKKISALIEELSTMGYSAVILFIPSLSERNYRDILLTAPPKMVIISAATVYNTVLDTVSFDSYRGGHLVGHHFDERGYKELGVVIGNTQRNESLLRKSGFSDYIEHHSDMQLIWQYEGDYSFESGQAAFENYSRLAKKPRAIFLLNDYMCFGFMEQARRREVRIPEDIALCGYDDLPICKYHYPSLSSITTSYSKLGETALEMIQEKIREKNYDHAGQVRMIPVSLTIRDSS